MPIAIKPTLDSRTMAIHVPLVYCSSCSSRSQSGGLDIYELYTSPSQSRNQANVAGCP